MRIKIHILEAIKNTSKTFSRVEGIRTWWLKGLKRREVKSKKQDLEDLPDSIKSLARCSYEPRHK